MINKETRNNYFNSFVKEICKYLKDGFGLIMSYYGYTNGSVVKIELKNGASHHIEDKQDSEDIADALFKTKLLSKDVCDSFRGKSVDSTIVAITSINCYLLLKSDDEKEWKEEAASNDFKRIYKKVFEKYDKKK